MIQITRDRTKVEVNINSNIGKIYSLSYECNSEPYAILLRQHLHDKLVDEITAIRKAAYEKGWKDAKAKVKKDSWFYGWWQIKN